MAAVPWKARRRSAQDRVDTLSRQVRELREELHYARLTTLQAVNRSIETGEVSTLPQLKMRLVKQIQHMENDLAELRDSGDTTPLKYPSEG